MRLRRLRSRTAPRALACAGAVVLMAAVGCASPGAADGREAGAEAGVVADDKAPAPSLPRTAPATAPGAGTATALVPADRTDPRTGTAVLAIPAIGVADLDVVPYEGTTDDPPGSRIQDRGVASSPYGEEGGVGPGEVGNYLVTAHRLSAGGVLRELPDLGKGDSVYVTEGGTRYTYEITETRQTSFRSERSLAEQRAEVPGRPGAEPTRAMITISTCATPEDDAAGNFWRDALGNPEHRIDKVGVLVSERPAS
ncbi:class E sortase [Streptomyces sp. BE282]|uniref:class E sortase n=1 Tax=Streptomyces TaxID=1883 RepID=UPI002E773DDC|nr:class E sortase [Streptomyces sp. BE282]MEE1732661.1 class E sortase [Streptomyces sp. BE282]